MLFKNRTEAGKKLGAYLARLREEACVVLALPRGGVPVAYQVALSLDAPLDLVITGKIGHPMSPEYGIGAVSEDGHEYLNPRETAQIDQAWLKEEIATEFAEAKRRREAYLDGRPPISLEGKTAVLVDDGIATGYTMLAAIRTARARKAKRVVVAVPVATPDTRKKFENEADEMIVAEEPKSFFAIGQFYEDFNQVEDGEVIGILGTNALTGG